MAPNEKRGRVKMQLAAAEEKLEDARVGLRQLGRWYRPALSLVEVAGRLLETASGELSEMRKREVSGNGKE